MNITFTPQPIPELTLQYHQLWITVDTDKATWEAKLNAACNGPEGARPKIGRVYPANSGKIWRPIGGGVTASW